MIPEEIRRHRPKGTEIHAQGGRYYVYKTTSVWDPEKKRARKKTLGCIGKITAGDGFVPSVQRPMTGKAQVKEYGCFALFSQLVPELAGQLRDAFGNDIGRRIWAVAMLRLMGAATKAGVRRYYKGSWLSEELPGLALSENTMTQLLRSLGNMRDAIIGFFKVRMPRDATTMLFDGTTVLTSSKDMTYARHGRAKKSQINLLYAFDADRHSPVWYRLLPGNIADMAAFKATLEESGMSSCIIVADKGFFSKANVSALDKADMSYVLPLRANTTLVDTGFLDDEGTGSYDGCFEYHGRVIWHRDAFVGNTGKRVCVFRDDGKRAQLELNYVRRMAADFDGHCREGLEKERLRYGISYIYTNLDADAKEVYLTYKARWEIEECFDYLKNGLGLGTVYQRTNEEAEAWAFLNHISLTLFYALYAAVLSAKLPSRWTPESVMAMAKTVNRVKIGETWLTTEVSKADSDVFRDLGVIL